MRVTNLRCCVMTISGLVLVVMLSNAEVDAFRDELNAGKKPDGSKLLKSLSVAARDGKASADALVSLGRMQLYTDDAGAAALTLDEAVAKFPNDADAHLYRGIAAQRLRKPDVAKRHFERVTIISPKDTRGWTELGATLFELGRDADAVEPLKKAAALDAKNAKARAFAGAALMNVKRGAEGIVLMEESLKLDPGNLFATYNAGQYYQLNDKPKLALERFNVVAKKDPNDWHVRAKLVQINQALGDIAARDRARAEVFALKKAGKVPADVPEFCREQFSVGTKRLMVFESFELIDPRAIRYAFKVRGAKDGAPLERVISLGSYDFTTKYMLGAGELKPGERAWHLDGYTPDNSHQTFGIFTTEPSYEDTRSMVVDVLSGKLTPSSSTSGE